MSSGCLLLQVLRAPRQALALPPLQWDLLIRQARAANLLARLAAFLDEQGLTGEVPAAPRLHLQAAQRIAERQRIATRWEVACIRQAAGDATRQLVLLKGAAYLMAGLPHASSRLFSDVDVMVRRAELPALESALQLHGWRGEEVSAYTQRYYRRWMHEIPPLHHLRRGTVVDVHHTILPPTARIKINTEALFDGLIPMPGLDGVHVLQPADMLLHSATHLFHEGEFDNGLRDLADLDALIRHFGAQPSFWPRLQERAAVLGLERPLFYALRYTRELLDSPVPQRMTDAGARNAPGGFTLRLMDACYRRALLPVHASCNDRATRIARGLLYLRSHWMRMPLHLLAYHMGRKLLLRMLPEKTAADTGGDAAQR